VTRLDLLVHAAGSVALGTTAEAPVRDLDHQYRSNVRVPFLLTQALLPLLRAARGQVVFVNSGAGLDARAGWGAYAASKHALRAMANALREEEQPHGIRVLSVYPGRTATPMQEAVHRMEGREYDPERFLQPEDVAIQVATAIELPERAAVLDLSIRPTRA
jgi:NAD(P)-dependent dehydrogenase (short-subunit alcohol dehydrogenase family)